MSSRQATTATVGDAPSQNTRPRPRVSYRELDELSDEDISELTSSRARRQIHEPSRRSQRAAVVRPSYNELSSDATSDDSEEDSGHDGTRRPIKRVRYSPKKQHAPVATKRSEPYSRPSSQGSSKKRNIGVVATQQKAQTPSPSANTIPPWQALPYHILLQIFEYAAYPLYQSALQPSSSIYWLLDTSRLCRSFHEAAVSALIKSPPLYPLYRSRDLIRLLKKTQDVLSMNFQSKIRCLEVEAKHLLVKKRPIDLPALIRLSPQLKDLRIYHTHDEIGVTLWSRPSATSKSTRWDYSQEVFDALDETNIYLRSFEWNGRFPASSKVIEDIVMFHERQTFQRLESLTLLNLATSDKASEQEEGTYEKRLMEAVARLPSIKRLSFQNCTVVNERLVQRMPHGLESLTVIDCVSLTSAEMAAFLRDKGMSLKELQLDANQSLDLAFADNLASYCPRLQSLKVDLTYYDASAYHDVEPYFDHLLPTGPPTWPSSLQVIELSQLRSWDMQAAEEFFQSLANSAPELHDLRYLSLKAILKCGWRDRAEFRKKWKDRFEKIFLRKWEEPQTNSRVVHRQAADALEQNGQGSDVSATKSSASPPTPLFPGLSSQSELLRPSTASSHDQSASQRKSSRIPVVTAQREEALRQEAAQAAAEEERAQSRREAMAAARKAAVRRRKEEERLEMAEDRRSRSTRSTATMNMEKDEDNDEHKTDEDEVPFIQGLCNTVLFRIDDQRPAEAQFTEGDFVDEELSGDEDWNGVDIDFEEEWTRKRGRGRKYAW